MQTVFETRRVRLESLVAKHGTVAALNEAIGMTRTDATLSQIRNPNLRRASSGKRYEMGDAIARRIETSRQARLKKFSAELLTTISEALTIASITPMEAPCHTPNRPARPPAALTAR